jgi:hypothetical protein
MSVFCSILRWIARLAALIVAIAFGYLIVGEITSPNAHPPSHLRDWLGIALIACVLVGMMLAWIWELAGALFSLLALATFVVAVRLNRPNVILVLAIPGILFLIDYALRRSLHRTTA